MPRIHFIAPHRPGRSPSQRHRIEQFITHLERNGFRTVYHALFDERDDVVFYSQGRLLGKALILFRTAIRRFRHLREVGPDDIVFIHREAFMTRGLFFERALRRRADRLVFDFDDAIWRMDVSEGNRALRWLKDPGKTADIIAMADLVIAGNEHLAEYARRFNPRVETIPTVVDTERYKPMDKPRPDGRVTIGWTGSLTSLAHLRQALPMLRAVQQRFSDRVLFRVVSDRPFEAPGLTVENVRWNSATEPEDLAPIDIGIMPMPDDEWSKGKCGFKGLQCMAMGKAVVLSAVGVNPGIVQDGVNGFLAATDTEWLEKLSRLVEDADLRRRFGRAARATVEERYSVLAWRDRYPQLLNDLLGKQQRGQGQNRKDESWNRKPES